MNPERLKLLSNLLSRALDIIRESEDADEYSEWITETQTALGRLPALVINWEEPETQYDRGNREWLACTEQFYDDMLNVLPPIYQGPCFGVCEAWKDNGKGEPVHIWFRRQGQGYVCRMASRREIMEELKQHNERKEQNAS